MNKVEIVPITVQDDLGFDSLGMDLAIYDDSATLADFLTSLDAFAAIHIADCRGCDGCCRERAPLIAADIPALTALLPPTPYPAHAVCAAFAELSVDHHGAADIYLRRNPDGACCLLDPDHKWCTAHTARTFACRSHFCLARSVAFALFREEVVNTGENALTRLLLAEEANGAPPLQSKLLATLLDPADYPLNPQSDKTAYDQILIRETVSDALWRQIKKEG
jgi:Fe-S-cluster containining protein